MPEVKAGSVHYMVCRMFEIEQRDLEVKTFGRRKQVGESLSSCRITNDGH